MSDKPGYMIAQGRFFTEKAQNAYRAAIGPIYAQYGGKHLAVAAPEQIDVAEGDPEGRRLILVRFDSAADARRYWDSPDYAEAKKTRAGASEFYVMIVEGLPERPPESESGGKPGYLIVQGVFHDPEKQAAYSAALPPIYEKYGGHYLAAVPHAAIDVAEGAPENRSLVVAKFPSVEAARAFWDSPDYAEAKKLREGGGEFYVMIVEGLA